MRTRRDIRFSINEVVKSLHGIHRDIEAEMEGISDQQSNQLPAFKNKLDKVSAAIDYLILYEYEKAPLFNAPVAPSGPLREYMVQMTEEYEQRTGERIEVRLNYVDDMLSTVQNLDHVARISKNKVLVLPLPLNRHTIDDHIKAPYYRVTLIETADIKQKLLKFKKVYKEVFGKSYGYKDSEALRWEQLPKVRADEFLLEFYMKSQTYPIKGAKSIGDYVRNYEQIQQLYMTQMKKDELPDTFDKALYEKLRTKDSRRFMKYRAKLKELGYRKTHNPSEGELWVK